MAEILKRLSALVIDKNGKKKVPIHKRFYSQGLTPSELRRMFRREE